MGIAALVVVSVLSQAPEAVGEGPASSEARPPPVVVSVELRLPPGTEAGLVAEAPRLVAVGKGQELSRRAVQRTIQLLMGTGKFADVVVYGEEVEGGIAIVIEASPKRRVGEVFVEKNTYALSSDAVIAASKLKDSEYSPESIAEAIENVRLAYRRKGYLHAQVDPQATAGARGLDVVLVVTEGEPTRLSSVSFAGETGLPLERMLQTMDLEIGEVVDQDVVERGAERLRTLLRTERYFRARVEAPVLDDEGRLSVPLQSGPRYTVEFRGNRRFPDSVLEAVNAYDGTEALDRGVVERMANKLAAFYRFRGFHDARVLGRESVSPDGREALLIFEIDEGEQIVVSEIAFAGNEALTDKDLVALLVEVMKASAPQPAKVVSNLVDGLEIHGRMKEQMLFDMPSPPPETVLVESAYREAASAMRAVYRDRGFVEAKVELEPIVIENRRAQVRYSISEGSRVVVEDVKYEGGPLGFPPADRGKSLVGQPFSPRAVERAAQALATDLARRGYVYAKVDGEWTIEKGNQARLSFRIELGPEVTVGKVLILGLRRTDESVARGQLLIEEGKLLNPDELLDSQRNLIALGIFRTAEVKLLAPETAEPIKDVLVELVEAPRLQFEGSFGYYLAEGVRVAGDVQVPNLGGQALSLQAHLQAYYFGASAPATTGRVDVSNIPQYFQVGGRANVSLQNRGLLARAFAFLTGGDTKVAKAIRGADIGTRLDTVAERVFRQSYQFNRAAIVPGIDWTGRFDVGVKWARLKLTLLWQYEFDVSDVRPVRSFTGAQLPLLRTDTERLRFLFGTFALSTVRFAPTLDLRDDPVLPHRGFVLSTPIEMTGAQYAVDNQGNPVKVQFIKLSGQLTAYFPLGPSVVLAISGRAGNIFPLTDSITPPVKRFFLGGAANLRGFPEDSMLPEDVRADYRGDVRNCQSLANPYACSEVAQNIRDGRYQPSPGGEFFALAKAELRFPFVGDLNLGLFFEAGNLWLDPRKISATLRPVAGGGLRYLSPIGPLALDVGFNLQPDTVVNESLFNVHFNVGVF